MPQPSDQRDIDALAKLAYEAQRAVISNSVFRPWSELLRIEQEGWRAAVRAIAEATRPPP